MTAGSPAPRVSVVIPAWKRHDLFPRAVRSVLNQTFADWELVVSDDETEPNPNRTFTQELAARDARVRLVINPGPHGQAGNHDHAISHARAEWVKILHNDDVLEPACLEEMLRAATLRDRVALCACLVSDYYDGRMAERRDRRPQSPAIVLLPRARAQLAMYLQDVEVGVPSALLVRREAWERGARFTRRPDLVSNVDSLWEFDLLDHGDLVILRRPLAQWHHGEHESVTSAVSEEAFFRELGVLRELFLPRLDPSLRPAPLGAAKGMTRLLQSIKALRAGEPGRAARLALGVRRPLAWWLFARYLLRRMNPNITIVRREVLQD